MHRLRCRRVRGTLERWLDSRAATPMPQHVAEHIRECSDCRTYVTRWNAVELQLRSVRDAWPARHEVEAVMAGLARPSGTENVPLPALRRPSGRMLLAGVTAMALAVVALGVYLALAMRSPQTLASGGSAASPIGVEAMGAVQREAPMFAPR